MIRCPICRRSLSPSQSHPYAPICSEACLREALRRAGIEPPPEEDQARSAPAQFEHLRATHLYCPTCGGSMPVRERLLLTLPSGDLHSYVCARCGTDVGTKTSSG